MKLPGYYSSGEFAKKAHITKKTVRYYDEHNILKPSYVNENGARFYNDDDFARLQQILFLKYLGFSLDDIKEMTLRNTDSNVMSESLHMQLGLVEERIEQMKLMKSALQDVFLNPHLIPPIFSSTWATVSPSTSFGMALRFPLQPPVNFTLCTTSPSRSSSICVEQVPFVL